MKLRRAGRDAVVAAFLLFAWPLTAPTHLSAAPQGKPGQVSPQLPARDTVPRASGATFRVRGRVLAAETGAPIRRAIVHITSQALPDGRATLTDADGRYEFDDLPAGNYYVSASKTGFLTAQPGSELLGADGGKSVRTEGASDAAGRPVVTAADIALTRASAIAGRVVDELGDPVGNAYVQLLRAQPTGGVRRLTMAGASNTNDLGQYRAYGLRAGTYLVFVETVRGAEGEVGEGAWYAPSYYPGTANFAEATAIPVSAGQEVAGADIVLSPVRTTRVSGMVLDSRGLPAANASVSLTTAQPGIIADGVSVGNYSRVPRDGTFSISGVPPGEYYLSARISQPVASAPSAASPAARVEYGRQRVSVGGSETAGVVIQASAGAAISGQLVFETARPPKANLVVEAVSEIRADAVVFTNTPRSAPAQVAPDGSFALSGVFGDRLLRVNGLPPGLTLKAVYVGGRNVTDTPLALEGREQLTGVQVVVTDRITHLAATALDADGAFVDSAFVFVVPEDPGASIAPGSRFVRYGSANGTGQVKIDGLPPGRYVAVAFRETVKRVDIYDPDCIERVRKIGTKFSLREAETHEIVLKVAER